MNNDRLKFRTPYYLPNPDGTNEFVALAHWNATIGRPNMMVVWGNDEQCTGLRDKSGNLIFEGDIIRAPNTPQKYIITWGHHGFISTCGCHSYPMSGTDLFEIIGNIHEQKG